MYRKGAFALCLLLSFTSFAGGDRKYSHYVFLELGGTGGLGSINYERKFFDKEKLDITWRLGLTALPIDKNNGVSIIFPATLQAIHGKGPHFFETGIGLGTTVTTKGSFYARMTPIVGYRFEQPKKKLFFRITYTPFVSFIFAPQYQHWAGVSLGWKLKGLNDCDSCLK